MPVAPTRNASGSAEIISGRSNPAVSMRSPMISARAVRREGAGEVGEVSVMSGKLRRGTVTRQRGRHWRGSAANQSFRAFID